MDDGTTIPSRILHLYQHNTMVLDFPYTVHDGKNWWYENLVGTYRTVQYRTENLTSPLLLLRFVEPTEDWNMEQVMHWWLLRAQAENEATFDETASRLNTQLDDGKATLWDDHQKVSSIVGGGSSHGHETENADPQQPPSTTSNNQKMLQQQSSATQSSDTIHIELMGGEYQGETFDLQPKARAYAWVGRSQGKKFREKGISLAKDLEVSTTHGRFELQGSKFFFVDTGSTNGSRVNNAELEPNQPVELYTGIEVTVGQTVMRVTVPY
jgi:hypothetical protein